jgi:hypothetical protein
LFNFCSTALHFFARPSCFFSSTFARPSCIFFKPFARPPCVYLLAVHGAFFFFLIEKKERDRLAFICSPCMVHYYYFY